MEGEKEPGKARPMLPRGPEPLLVARTFDAHAHDFDRWYKRHAALHRAELSALRAARPRGLIVDLGVGSGVFASAFRDVVGVDISAELLRLAKSRGVEPIRADVLRLPLRSSSFDTALIAFTICFVSDPALLLREAARVLKPRGRLILGEVPKESRWGLFYGRLGRRGHRFYSLARFLTRRQTLLLLRRAGLRLVAAYGTLSFPPGAPERPERPRRLGDPRGARPYGFVVLKARKGA